MRISIDRDDMTLGYKVTAEYYDTKGQRSKYQTLINKGVAENPFSLAQVKYNVSKTIVNQLRKEVEEANMSPQVYRGTDIAYQSQVSYWYDVQSGTAVTNTAGDMYNMGRSGDLPQQIISPSPRLVTLKFKVGKRELVLHRELGTYQGEINIEEKDIEEAKVNYIREAKINIITRRAEVRAEDLLQSLIPEIDFRNYKEKGFFLVKQGNKVFRVWKDNHKYVDMFENESGIFVPKNRLCLHTATRELPLADEVVTKLMLIKSNRIVDRANLHAPVGLVSAKTEKELLLV